MNWRHRSAQLADRASVQLRPLIFFSGKDGGGEGGGIKEEDAYMLDVEIAENAEPSFTVMVPRYGIDGPVRLSHLATDDSCLLHDPENFRMSYNDANSGKVLGSVAVFDKVRVKIWVKISRDHRELVLDLIELAKPVVGASKSKSKKQKTKK